MKKAFNMKKKHLSFLKGFQLFEFVSDLHSKDNKDKQNNTNNNYLKNLIKNILMVCFRAWTYAETQSRISTISNFYDISLKVLLSDNYVKTIKFFRFDHI